MGDLAILRRYHAVLKPFRGLFLVAIGFDALVTLLALLMPLFTRVLFDYAYAYRDLALLNQTILAIIVTYFLYFFLSVAAEYLQAYINQETTVDLTRRVFHAIQRLPLRFHQEKRSGDLLLRITEDVSNAIAMVSGVLPTLLIDGGRLLAILAIAFVINAKLTLLALLAVPLYVLETRFYAGRLARVEGESIDADANIYTSAQERLANVKTIKAYGQEENETLSFAKLLRRRYRVAIKGRLLEIAQSFTNSLTLQMWTVFLTWFLGYQVVQGRLTIGEIIALMLYLEQLGDPIRSLLDLFTAWKTSLVSMRRLDEVLESPGEDEGAGGGSPLTLREGDVQAVDLSFCYAPDEEVLHAVDVEFAPHSVSAIVGASGSGKTTLVNLLLRFFDPSQGMILVDGQNISEVRVHELRGQIGMVMQDASLFDGTIVDNILYGNAGRSRGDAMEAARLAGAHDFIERLPGGYDAPVGVGGELLSGGQRQRIAIARTLLRHPRVIIFDEATSALDAESEYRIQEAVAKLRKSKTVIVIAHRLSTIKTADVIFVLEEGRFVERGTFEELIEKRGAFSRYYWRQFGGLAAFRQQLALELERAARYGSTFGVGLLSAVPYSAIEREHGPEAAEEFMEALDLAIKRRIRMGDNCARLGRERLLLLLPETDGVHLGQFFERMQRTLPTEPGDELPYALGPEALRFIGTHITRKAFRTPEELIAALERAEHAGGGTAVRIVDEEELVPEERNEESR